MGISASLACRCCVAEDASSTPATIVASSSVSRSKPEQGCCSCEDVTSEAPSRMPSRPGNDFEARKDGEEEEEALKFGPSDSNASTRANSRANSRPGSSATSRANSRATSRANSPKQSRANSPKPPDSRAKSPPEKKSKARQSDAKLSESEDSDVENKVLTKDNQRELFDQELKAKDIDSLLLIASYVGNVEMLKYCFDNDGVSTVSDHKGFMCGYHAAMSGDVEALKVLVKHDSHCQYKEYFEDKITSDNMTPLMLTLRHGLTEVYEYLIGTLGCKLKLRGDRFGSNNDPLDPEGYKEPLHKWLECVPEVSHINHVLKRRPLELTHRKVDFNAPVSEADYASFRERRLQARNYVRKIWQQYQGEAAKFPSKRGSNGRGSAVEVEPAEARDGRRGNKRGALLMPLPMLTEEGQAAGGEAPEPQPLLPSYDVEATVVTQDIVAQASMMSMIRSRSNRGAQAAEEAPQAAEETPQVAEEGSQVIWVCGHCTHSHTQVLAKTCVLQCDNCPKKNFIRVTPAMQESPRSACDDSDDGEAWTNDGGEFAGEKTVAKYLAMFKRSNLIHLGVQRLRQVLRVAKYTSHNKGAVLFEEDTHMEGIWVLQQGSVALQTGRKKKTVIITQDITVAEHVKGTPPPRLQLLDLRAYVAPERHKGYHDSTCTVTSKKAMIFQFVKSDIFDYCSCDDLDYIVTLAMSNAILTAVPLLRVAFSEDEQLAVAETLQYIEYPEGHFLTSKGQRHSDIMLIQKGKIKVTEGKKPKVIHVCPDKVEVAPGEFWQPVYMIGVRLLLYDMPSPCSVEVLDSTPCECWKMETSKCDKVLKETNLLHHLQVGTYIIYLLRVMLFKKLSKDDVRLRKLLLYCQTEEFWFEENFLVQGDVSNFDLFILLEGTVGIVINGVEVASQVADIDKDKVHFYGELALIENAPRTATVRVKSSSATTLRVTLEGVNNAFGSLERLLDEQGLTASKVMQMADKKNGRKVSREDGEEAMAMVATTTQSRYDGKWDLDKNGQRMGKSNSTSPMKMEKSMSKSASQKPPPGQMKMEKSMSKSASRK